MFNLFPKFGSPGDMASPEELIGKYNNSVYPTWSWTTSIKDADGNDVSVADLISKYNEAMKEIKNLNHLKEENVQLIERINEIDSDMNKEYQAEIFTLKNDIAVLKAKYQILDHNYQGCTKHRDEYKHQLNAANKEIEALKSKLRDYQDRLAESFSYSDMKKLQNKIDEQKHPMYPLHWGGYEPEKWSTTKVAVDDAVQAKLREVYGIEENKTFKPWVEEPIDWKGKEVEFNAKELLNRVTECAESLPESLPNELQEDKEWVCPCNKCKDAREGRKESDFYLRVNKLEEQLEIHKLLIDQLNKYILCQKQS